MYIATVNFASGALYPYFVYRKLSRPMTTHPTEGAEGEEGPMNG